MDAHPAWWAAAADLRPGDRLHTPHGWAEVDKVVPRPGTDRVYNLTVEHQHLFRVGRDAILVHNTRCDELLQGAVTRNGDEALREAGHFRFPNRRAARQAASELAGDLGVDVETIRLSEFRGLPWNLRDSTRVTGRQTRDNSVGWRDDFLGHERFGAGPHVNVWIDGREFHFWY